MAKRPQGTGYGELVKKARALRMQLGHDEFRRRYERSPTQLMEDIGARRTMSRITRSVKGTEVLQAFPFYPLQERLEGLYREIVERHGSQPLYNRTLSGSKDVPHSLRILEARGLITTEKMNVGRGGPTLVVSSVYADGRWKKAIIPKK